MGSTVELSGIHPTYADLPALRNAATLVAVGQVKSSRDLALSQQALDPDGVEATPLPMTEYAFAIERVVKGAASAEGTTVAVRVVGGAVDGTVYVVEGSPRIDVGSSYLLFLRQAADGSWFPLAGDGAVASRTPAGDYLLPPGVAGEAPVQIPASDVLGESPPQASTPPSPVTTPGPQTRRQVRLRVRARSLRRSNGSVLIRVWGQAGPRERGRRVLVEGRIGARWRPLCRLTVRAAGAFTGDCGARSFVRTGPSSVVLRASLPQTAAARRTEARVNVKLPARDR